MSDEMLFHPLFQCRDFDYYRTYIDHQTVTQCHLRDSTPVNTTSSTRFVDWTLSSVVSSCAAYASNDQPTHLSIRCASETHGYT